MVVVSEVRKGTFCLLLEVGFWVGVGVLWVLGLPDGVKDRIRKYGLVFIEVMCYSKGLSYNLKMAHMQGRNM